MAVLNLNNVLIVWMKLRGLWSASKPLVEGPAKALGSGPDSSFEVWLWGLVAYISDYFIESATYGFIFRSCKTLENERVSFSKFCNE